MFRGPLVPSLLLPGVPQSGSLGPNATLFLQADASLNTASWCWSVGGGGEGDMQGEGERGHGSFSGHMGWGCSHNRLSAGPPPRGLTSPCLG